MDWLDKPCAGSNEQWESNGTTTARNRMPCEGIVLSTVRGFFVCKNYWQPHRETRTQLTGTRIIMSPRPSQKKIPLVVVVVVVDTTTTY